jgi:hypothetical protein
MHDLTSDRMNESMLDLSSIEGTRFLLKKFFSFKIEIGFEFGD